MLSIFFKKPKVKISILELFIEELTAFEYNSVSSVYSSDKSIIEIYSLCKTIGDYTNLLNNVVGAYKEERILGQYEIPREMLNIGLTDFYLDNAGCYIDYIKASQTLIEVSIEYLRIVDKEERNTDKPFSTERNLTLTQDITTNLIAILKNLIEDFLS